jgi:hypothetical protein
MLIILILIGCYYLINVLIFVGIHTKKTSNVAYKPSYTSINNTQSNRITSVVNNNFRNNEIQEPLLSPVSETQYDVGYQLN